jgi:hypothetical protein
MKDLIKESISFKKIEDFLSGKSNGLIPYCGKSLKYDFDEEI